MTHSLEIQKPFADALLDGTLTFDIRTNDRGYQKGDIINYEVVDRMGLITSHRLNDESFIITYVLSGHGLQEGYVAFGVEAIA